MNVLAALILVVTATLAGAQDTNLTPEQQKALDMRLPDLDRSALEPQKRTPVEVTGDERNPFGLLSVPPPGPAMPVVDKAKSAPETRRAPSAMAAATGSLTAPCTASRSAGTPSASSFVWLAYVTKPAGKISDAPGTSVMRPANDPPVQDSAVARVSFFSRSRPTTAASSGAPSE